MSAGLTERLPRLLSLVPYLLARPGIPVAEVAADFGISERQLRRDLELLWMCGLPGYGPGDLVDLSFSGDTVTVTEDAGMRRPLRLTTAEATALLVALRTLADLPGVVDTAAVRRATAKIERAVGDAGAAGVAVEVARAGGGHHRGRAGGAGGRAGRCGSATTRRAATRSPAAPSTRCGCSSSRAAATWRRGAGGPRRCGCSGWTGSTTSRCSTSRPPPRRTPSPPTCRTGCSGPARAPAARCCCWSPRRGGWPSTTRWSRSWRFPPSCPPSRTGPAPGMITAVMVTASVRGEGRARVLLRYADPAWLVRLVLGLGGGARLLEPPELAAEVARRAAQALALAAGAAGIGSAGTGRERSGDDGCRRGAGGAGRGGGAGARAGCPPARPAAQPQRGGTARGHRGRLARLRALRAAAPRRR